VYILGGAAAVSNNIEKTLKDSGYTVERLSGPSRYETAVMIARKLEQICGTPTELFISNGTSFADALSAGPVAAAGKSPILYVRPSGELDSVTGEFISSNSVKNVVVLGGPNSISENIIHSLSTYGTTDVQRVAGKDRYITCLEIIKTYSDRFASIGTISIATGKAFPDALAGGAFAASINIPLLLTNTNISDEIKEWLSGRETDLLFVFGGDAAVSDRTVYQHTV